MQRKKNTKHYRIYLDEPNLVTLSSNNRLLIYVVHFYFLRVQGKIRKNNRRNAFLKYLEKAKYMKKLNVEFTRMKKLLRTIKTGSLLEYNDR